MTAALMAGSNNLDTLVLESDSVTGGQSRKSSRIENFPGYSAGTTGEHLAGDLYEQTQRMKAEIQLNTRVTGLDYDDKTGLKTITTSDGKKIIARAVIIAGGVKLKKADWEGADSNNVVYGDGQKVAEMAEGKTAVVVGGSNGGGQAGLGATDRASHIYLLTRSPLKKGMSGYVIDRVHANDKITVVQGEIAKYENGIVHLKDSDQTISAASVGMFIGGKPDTGWLPPSIKLDGGHIKVINTSLETTMPGVFAVGDVRAGSVPRLVAAAGDGTVAESAVHKYFETLKKMESPEYQRQGKLF